MLLIPRKKTKTETELKLKLKLSLFVNSWCFVLFAFVWCATSYVYSDDDTVVYWIYQLNLKPETVRYYKGEGLFVGSLTNN